MTIENPLVNVQLLLAAIGNVIDERKDVVWITIPEIWEWLNDILGMMGDDDDYA